MTTETTTTTQPQKAGGQTPSEAVVKYSAFRQMVEQRKADFATALPKHMTPEKFARCVLTYATRAPEVLDCVPASIVKSLMDAAQMGLAPDGLLGSGYLVPFKKKRKSGNGYDRLCQFIPGYRGLIDLARRSGAVTNIFAYVVRAGDDYTVELGSEPRIVHHPALDEDKDHKPIIGAYAVAVFPDNTRQFEVLSCADLNKIQGASQAGASEFSPWATWPEEMARKSAVKRLCKTLPLSPELALAIERDNEAERGEIRDVEARVSAPRPKDRSGAGLAALANAMNAPSDPTEPQDDPRPADEYDTGREPGEE